MAKLHYGCELLALWRSSAWRGPLPAISSTQGIATFASLNVREPPPKESSELREVYFSRLFDIYLSHLLAVTQLLAEVIQPIQTAEIQRQRATFARFSHPDGGSRAQMLRKFGGQILSCQRGSCPRGRLRRRL